MSVRQSIRDRAIFELNAANPTGVPECTKRRFVPGEKLVNPRIAAYFGQEDASRPQGRQGAITRRKLRLVLQAMAAVNDPADADDAIEPMLEHIIAVMGDTNLDGLALDVAEVQTVWASANDAGKFYIVALSQWDIDLQTKRDDISAKQ